MAKQRSATKIEYTHEERASFVERVCALYESQNATLGSCCEAVGISYHSFYLWTNQVKDFKERYKKAKKKQDGHYWKEIIRPLAKTALQRRLEGETKTETKVETAIENGKRVERRRTETNVEILPDSTLTIFALKGLYKSKFAERKELTGKKGKPVQLDFDTSSLTKDEKRALLELLEKTKIE